MYARASSIVFTVKMNVRSLIFLLFCFTKYLPYGFSSNTVQRIINGSKTHIKFSFITSLRRHGVHMCGATVINKNLAVTAAHCLYLVKNPMKEVTLCSGTSFLSQNCKFHNITNFSIHEEYDNTTNDFDIAIIQVTPPFDKNTRAVNLPQHEYVFTHFGIICGWGAYQINEPDLSEELRCALVPQISIELCNSSYIPRFTVTNQMICYGFQQGGIDSCQGDSGGPIFNFAKVLIGITSWGDGCAKRNSPGVYTNVIRLRHWIEMKMKMMV